MEHNSSYDSLAQYRREITGKLMCSHEHTVNLFKIKEQSLQRILGILFTTAPEQAYRHVYTLEARLSSKKREEMPKIMYKPGQAYSKESFAEFRLLAGLMHDEHRLYRKQPAGRKHNHTKKEHSRQKPNAPRIRSGSPHDRHLLESIALAYKLPIYYEEWDSLIQKVKKDPLIGTEARKSLYAAEKEYISARNRIVESNLRLVMGWMEKLGQKHGLVKKDIIQEGNLGLMKAADRFDYRRGIRFSTYASYWIKHNIYQAIDRRRLIRLPQHTDDNIRLLAEAEKGLRQKLKRAPDDKELAQRLGWPLDKIRLLRKCWLMPLSLHQVIPGTERTTLEDRIEDGESLERIESAAALTDYRRLQRIMYTKLSARERDIIERRFGIGGEELTLEAAGQRYAVTRERARQIEMNALRKMRKHFLESDGEDDDGKDVKEHGGENGKLEAA